MRKSHFFHLEPAQEMAAGVLLIGVIESNKRSIIDVSTSKWSKYLPVIFLCEMPYLLSNFSNPIPVFCKTNFKLSPSFRILI